MDPNSFAPADINPDMESHSQRDHQSGQRLILWQAYTRTQYWLSCYPGYACECVPQVHARRPAVLPPLRVQEAGGWSREKVLSVVTRLSDDKRQLE